MVDIDDLGSGASLDDLGNEVHLDDVGGDTRLGDLGGDTAPIEGEPTLLKMSLSIGVSF